MRAIASATDPRFIKAMSHPVRARIMAMLGERSASPNELARWLGTSVGGAAYHVRTLHQLGLIELTDEVRVRGAVEHFYRARPLPDRDGDADAVVKQAEATSALTMLHAHLGAAAARGGFDRPEALMRRRALHLDERGWSALATEARKLLERVERIAQASANRLAAAGAKAEPLEASVVVMTYGSTPLADEIPPSSRRAPARRGPGGPSSSRRGRGATAVLDVLQQAPATASEIADATGLPLSSARLTIRQLLAERQIVVIDSSPSPSGRGRPRLVYTLAE